MFEHTPPQFIPKVINLGCAKNIIPGAFNCDIRRGPGVDKIFDAGNLWPFDDESVDKIQASHVLEHIQDLNTCMKEAHRVLKVGGLFEIAVPYGPRGTFCNDDPNHVREFAPSSLSYYLRGNDGNTTLEADWENPLFKCESCEVIRIFWQREKLGKLLGRWIEKRYSWPSIGIPVEIKWILRKV